MAPNERRSAENGIWLCQTCSKLVDSDESRYSVEALKEWKVLAEKTARQELEQRRRTVDEPNAALIKAERLMPQLLAEMRNDLATYPLKREFVISDGVFVTDAPMLRYRYEDHPDLDDYVRVLQNIGLVGEIPSSNRTRFYITEQLADYLMQS